MQVTETLSDGLKRAYDVVIPASDLAARLDSELTDLKGKVRINGFRPGKVPMGHLKRLYGRSVMADLVQKQIEAANKKIVDDGGFVAQRQLHRHEWKISRRETDELGCSDAALAPRPARLNEEVHARRCEHEVHRHLDDNAQRLKEWLHGRRETY